MRKISFSFAQKFIASFLAIAVVIGGTASLSSAMVPQNKMTIKKSVDEKSSYVYKDDKLALTVIRKTDFEATVSRTNSKNQKEILKVTVTPRNDNKYVVAFSGANNQKSEFVSTFNPLMEKAPTFSKQTTSVPDLIVKTITDGNSPSYGDFAGAFGGNAAMAVVANWGTLVAAFESGGYWAVFAIVSGWEIVGAALVGALVY
jgi:hypothetical protein